MLPRLERERWIVGVVVANESNMALYFPEAGNLNDSNIDMFSNVAGRRVAARPICLSFNINQISRNFTISPCPY